MAESLTTAPVLSTPDNHILTETEPTLSAQPISDLQDEQFRTRYEIDRTIKVIREQRWRRIALQFPDHMLPHSSRVFQMLSRGLQIILESGGEGALSERIDSLSVDDEPLPVRLTILADTSYGSCCVDEIAAEHVDADAVVHYGRACLSPTARLPVLHIFTRAEIDETAAVDAFVDAFPDLNTKVILTADIPFASHIKPILTRLCNLGYDHIYPADIVHDPSSIIPNRTVPEEISTDTSKLIEWHLYHIAEPPTSLLLNLASKVRSIQIYNPGLSDIGGKVQAQEANTTMILRRRYALVTSMNTVSTWGILINTLSVKSYLHVVEYVKKQIAAAGKKSYLIVVGKLNAAKVANFSEIGGWVVIGCWESSLIDSKDFFKPILTPFELELSLASDDTRIWTGAWRSDFQSFLEDTGSSEANTVSHEMEKENVSEESVDLESEEESAPPEFDLRTGRYVSQSRPMGRRQAPVSRVQAAGGSRALIKKANGDLVAVNGVASPGAEFLAQKRTWKGLGSDFEIQYEDEEVEGVAIEEGQTGLARGYVVGDAARS